MSDFSYLNYHTIYEVKGTVNRDMQSDCCFCYVTKYYPKQEMDNTYTIIFCKGMDMEEEHEWNNFCLLDESDINSHMRMLQKYYNFDYTLESCYSNGGRTISDTKGNGCNFECWKLTLHIVGHYIWHKFILINIRPFYEFPFNFALMDVRKLRKEEPFSKYTTLNLMGMVVCTFNKCSSIDCIDDQSIYAFDDEEFPKFKSREKYIERIEQQKKYIDDYYKENVADDGESDCLCCGGSIHNIHDYTYVDANLYSEIDSIDCRDMNEEEYWFSSDSFDKRKELYLKLLPELKA